ncbi:NAD(P)H dehydrogenase (quinone) [Lacibacter cauensis]|uniref:NAD(P)H dehydrogenase (Quinone) n=1 Tax=Lacibacter cauensis TaxID=510947 RepID=A0A562SPV4_9BACT|nr:SDR family oxidoreductase [Lacibacter cauensis]TWI83064.1 NAD(P)H dehydrogenase (quinone) [Lacibacter cauensis]
MILVTGATGQLGTIVVNELLKKIPASELAVLVRDENKAAAFQQQGVSIRVATYQDKAALATALQGIDKVLFISSSDFNDRLGQHKNVVDAAKTAGVKHLLYTGVTMQNFETSPLNTFMSDHYQTDAYIKASGLTYTLLQHSLYADVIPMFAGPQATDTGIFFPAGEGKVSFAVRQDLGEAAANILVTEGHENKTYELTGEVAYSFADIATTLSTLVGKTVQYISPEPAAFEEALKGLGLPAEIIGMSAAFAAGIQNNDFNYVSPALEQLLGRKPTSLQAYLKTAYNL